MSQNNAAGMDDSPQGSVNEKAIDHSVNVHKSSIQDPHDLELGHGSKAGSLRSLSYMLRLKLRFTHHRLFMHVLVGLFFTGWWLSVVIQPQHRPQWVVPTVLWGMISVRLITMYCRILPWTMRYVKYVWDAAVGVIYDSILPKQYQRLLVGAAITVGVILVGTFATPENEFSPRSERAISFLGCAVLVLGLYASSNNRAKVKWNPVIGGYLMQYIIAVFVLRTNVGYEIFNFVSTLARNLLGFSKDGTAFLTNHEIANLPMFFFGVLPAVIFFVAFVHLGYYFGWIQWGIQKFASFFFWLMRVSGAEAMTAAASPFVGIGESVVLIKDLLPYLTNAELHQVMTSGFSTISGAVLVGYLGMGLNAEALVSSCVMSIPALLAASKLRFPETGVPVTLGSVQIPDKNEEDSDEPKSMLTAFSAGATLGVQIAGTMIGQTLCIIALVYLINGLLSWFGQFWNITNLLLELMLSYIFYPITFLLGTPRHEVMHVSTLIATKVVQNEYVAYRMLMTHEVYSQMSKRAKLIATYAVCGFSNFGSLGITLGVLSTLMDKSRAKDVANTIFSALCTGFIATLTSAAVAGMVVHDLDKLKI